MFWQNYARNNMQKEIIQKGAEILRVKCTSVTDFELARRIVQDLSETIDYFKTTYPVRRGVGLAAPQIGESVRISVVENTNGGRYVLINPEIIEHSETKTSIREGCLSFLQYRGMVPRYEWVKVKAFDLEGKEYEIEAEGDFAMLLQHELDHLDGILMFDHLPNKETDLFVV